ncbi:PLP-dependent transferase [Linderina pennispora]|uniref:PLP-dependent transferase n=1 Tax=Linderina pennispora TaxID=61395 RepID=A0A1Y1VZ75_9FUNG|nr:PLP-dependent transferase [Linderina pennispora]ORX66559.1 PLP-dependent transferase [Linderina pennispora]
MQSSSTHKQEPKDLTSLFVPGMQGSKKSMFKAVMGTPTLSMINMAGGVPDPSTFPIAHMSVQVRMPGGSQTETVTLDKTCRSGIVESIDELLQYGDGCGFHPLKYTGWDVIASCGNNDALSKVVALFCEPGDAVLVEKWTFPGALGVLNNTGIGAVPVELDSEGMVPQALDTACREWQGEKPLRVVYIIPTGQNPTGSIGWRKKHNLVIVEDDPYYFMHDLALVPSFLSLDTDGRVIRLDSFSKILAPNLRCGWVTAPSYILDRPSGLSQGVISKILNNSWGMAGWESHLRHLRATYARRRNAFVAAVEKNLAGLVEYTVPSAGMFLWMRIDLGGSDQKGAMAMLLETMKKCGVMMAPGVPAILRAAFALVEPEMFDPALSRLAQAIEYVRKSHGNNGSIGISSKIPAERPRHLRKCLDQACRVPASSRAAKT